MIVSRWPIMSALVSHVQLFVTPWIVAHQAPPSRIFQARMLEWVVIPFSRGSSQLKDQTQVSRIAGRLFTIWATRESWITYEYILLRFFLLISFVSNI